MDAHVCIERLAGSLEAIASKSLAHRTLICAALSNARCTVECPSPSVDIEATVSCLQALGAKIMHTEGCYAIEPLEALTTDAALDCRESGSTLRFLLPVVAALGAQASFTGSKRLAERPLSPLYEELCAHGCALSPQGSFPLTLTGVLKGGRFRLPGNISSQYISGLLLAASLMHEPVEIAVEEPIESGSYIEITRSVLASFEVEVQSRPLSSGNESYTIFSVDKDQVLSCRDGAHFAVEGDWSNSAFWLAAGALNTEPLEVFGLNLQSPQGDKAILDILEGFGAQVFRMEEGVAISRGNMQAATVDVSDCPDLVPPIALVASLIPGTTRIEGAGRLRLKESDRLETVSSTLSSLGAKISIQDESLLIEGVPELEGGEVDTANDHRICMMAALAASHARNSVTIHGAECVRKSYPNFFRDLAFLGAQVDTEV